MRKTYLIALLTASILCSLQPRGSSAVQEKAGGTVPPASQNSVKVTIATGGGFYDPPKSQFKIGEDIPVVISMTNTEDKPARYCRSTSLLQNRPVLKRDGRLIPHVPELIRVADQKDLIERCEKSAAQQFYELQPKQTKVVDWFKLSLTGIVWYGPLPPGHYELVLMRRIGCCQGPLLESNKVTFEIVP
ncbi:MAG TPA: hypothetical protein VGC87_07995 [Pyrinomonadaceae bacterium]